MLTPPNPTPKPIKFPTEVSVVGGKGKNGKLELQSALGVKKVIIGEDGHIAVIDDNGKVVFHLKGSNGTFTVGAKDNRGYIALKAANDAKNTVRLNGDIAQIGVGCTNHDGSLSLSAADNKSTVFLSGKTADLRLGCKDHDGDLYVRAADDKTTIHLNGDGGSINLGSKGHRGYMTLRDPNGKITVTLDGNEGDIILSNADCAEEFDTAVDEEIEPGMVMVLDEDSRLRPSRTAYDKKVAGVISGAGHYKPGIVLDRNGNDQNRKPIALVGKVFCRVDANYGSIGIGDLLTTSNTLGHAMKALNPVDAFGAVIGKALRELKAGKGLIPILVALQ